MILNGKAAETEPRRVTIADPSFGSAVLLVDRVTWEDTLGQIGVRNDAQVAGESPGAADARFVVERAIIGWEDVFEEVVQEDGSTQPRPVEFSAEALASTCTEYPLFGWLVWRAADNSFGGVDKDQLGNSSRPSETGSETAGATTPESSSGDASEPND